jgi:hypothetical protein
MLTDPIAAHTDDRFRNCLTLTASGQLNGESGRAARISQRHSPNTSPIRAVRHLARGRLRDRTRNLAPSISLLRVIVKGAGS